MKTREAFTFSVRGGRHFSQIVSEFSLDMTNQMKVLSLSLSRTVT